MMLDLVVRLPNPLLLRPFVGQVGTVNGRPIITPSCGRNYIEDEAGRRWLLDGSGDVA
jgi:hypothetical protein